MMLLVTTEAGAMNCAPRCNGDTVLNNCTPLP